MLVFVPSLNVTEHLLYTKHLIKIFMEEDSDLKFIL